MLAIRDAGPRAESASRFIARLIQPAGVPRYFRPVVTAKPAGKAKTKAVEELTAPAPDDVTTAAALTFYCWRYCIEQAGQEHVRRAGRLLADLVAERCTGILIDGLDTSIEQVEPYALAMLGRSMVAAWKFCGLPEYLDIAQLVATFLIRHDLLTWNAHECLPEYRKAAGLFRLVSRPTAFDDVDLRLFGDTWDPLEIPAGAAVGEQVQQLITVSKLLTSAEGLLMGEASAARAIAVYGQALEASRKSSVRLALLQAQIIRFAAVAKVRLDMTDGDGLLALQDDATGGFHEFSFGSAEVSPTYDVLATIYAVQALMMTGQSRLSNWPGALQKRDLMFI